MPIPEDPNESESARERGDAARPERRGAIDIQVTGKFSVRDSSFFGYETLMTGKYGDVDITNIRAAAPFPARTLADDLNKLYGHWSLLDEKQRQILRPSLDLVASKDLSTSQRGATMLKNVITETTPKVVAEILWRIVKGLGGE